jgi:hypothetical protein
MKVGEHDLVAQEPVFRLQGFLHFDDEVGAPRGCGINQVRAGGRVLPIAKARSQARTPLDKDGMTGSHKVSDT